MEGAEDRNCLPIIENELAWLISEGVGVSSSYTSKLKDNLPDSDAEEETFETLLKHDEYHKTRKIGNPESAFKILRWGDTHACDQLVYLALDYLYSHVNLANSLKIFKGVTSFVQEEEVSDLGRILRENNVMRVGNPVPVSKSFNDLSATKPCNKSYENTMAVSVDNILEFCGSTITDEQKNETSVKSTDVFQVVMPLSRQGLCILADNCLQIIQDCGIEALEEEEFQTLTPSEVELILSLQKNFPSSNLEEFNHLMSWASHQCLINNLDVTKENIKLFLGPIIFNSLKLLASHPQSNSDIWIQKSHRYRETPKQHLSHVNLIGLEQFQQTELEAGNSNNVLYCFGTEESVCERIMVNGEVCAENTKMIRDQSSEILSQEENEIIGTSKADKSKTYLRKMKEVSLMKATKRYAFGLASFFIYLID